MGFCEKRIPTARPDCKAGHCKTAFHPDPQRSAVGAEKYDIARRIPFVAMGLRGPISSQQTADKRGFSQSEIFDHPAIGLPRLWSDVEA